MFKNNPLFLNWTNKLVTTYDIRKINEFSQKCGLFTGQKRSGNKLSKVKNVMETRYVIFLLRFYVNRLSFPILRKMWNDVDKFFAK